MYTKNIRYITALLLVCFMIGFMASLIPVSAVSPYDEEAKALETEDRIALYISADNVFESAQAKLDKMKQKITRGAYTLYVDEATGEVAVKNNQTGQILSTNPYDLASTTSEDVKKELMSQVVVKFEDLSNSGVTRTFFSYSEAAARGQIDVKNIKNGIRVEYTLGKQTARRLLPRWIEKDRFETLLKAYIEAEAPTTAIRFGTFYSLKNVNDTELAATVIKEYQTKYPCTKKRFTSTYGEYMAIYVIDSTIVEREENQLEGWIKQYCPHYNYEELEYDHSLTGYQGADKSPAIFRLALEYYISDAGLKVTLPANSIRFDEDYYRLSSVSVLQYFGASSNNYTGYTFIPDGSGAIIRNEEIMSDGKNTYTISGQIYGADFAYHELSGFNGKSEVMRLPVYGVIEDTKMVKYNYDNQVGYVFKKDAVTDSETGAPVLYTNTDRIMVDAYNKDGALILSEEDFLKQYKYKINDDGTYDVIQSNSSAWNDFQYSEINKDDRTTIDKLIELKLIPYYECVTYYLMSPLVLAKPISQETEEYRKQYGLTASPEELAMPREQLPLTAIGKTETGKYKNAFDYVTYKGNQVFVYVDELGNQVTEANRVEGTLKVMIQLSYNGEPAYYDSDVPVHPEDIKTPTTTAADETEVPTEGEAPVDPAGTGAVVTEATPVTTAPEEGTEEPVDTIEYYNSIAKTKERYDEPAFEEDTSIVSQGYFAVITEGDALAQITSSHGAKNPEVASSTGLHKYNSVYTSFFPRPQDSYRLSDAISVGSSDKWTVVSDRKYTGSYTIEYTMLTDAAISATDATGKKVSEKYPYEGSYIGMANAYRDYLKSNGLLTKIEDTSDDIPLYLELLGMTQVKETVLTIPIMMDKALTSFDDIEAIYEQLSKDGIDDIRARLTYFTKNGMRQVVPSAMRFERVVGGNGGYVDMVEYCESVTSKDKGTSLKVYPDFDFANISGTALFDGVSYINDTIKTIDDRYMGKRIYDATFQSFQRGTGVCMSAEAYGRIYNKFAKRMNKLAVSGISVSTLGTDLNSDFNEDDPYNREDTKQFTIDLLKQMSEDYGKVMIDGGNAYALGYASDILYMSLDSSRYMRASAAVPFLGAVLHGYVNYAGDPTNTASDIYYETLKIIENGASPYFILAYRNSAALKENMKLSKYYAVDYNIWYDDMIKIYKQLNDVMVDVQTATISDHRFIETVTTDNAADVKLTNGIRSLTEKEAFEADILKAEAIANYEQAVLDAQKLYNDRKAVAERHSEAFTEVFEETYAYLESAEAYGEYVYNEYANSINRKITTSSVVSVTYTKDDGTSKTFILNYNSEAVRVDYCGRTYTVEGMGFVVAEN